jgi:hypothetical protein
VSLEVQDGNKPMPASDLVEAVLESTRRFGRCMEEDDWEGAGREIEVRNSLLEALSSEIAMLDRDSSREANQAKRSRIKRALEDIQSINAEFLDKLNSRVTSLRDKIKEIKRGRKALRLYRMPPRDQPRFFNRLG